MKNNRIDKQKADFIRKLVKYHMNLKSLKPREVYIFNVIATYGSYQVIIGPEYSTVECRKLHLRPRSRRLEINGSMHHLFVSPKRISPTPHQEDIKSNLKGSVIMKGLAIHIVDEDGRGASVKIERLDEDSVSEKQRINLAGDTGESMIKKFKSSGHLAVETYKIIQEDILKALKGS